MKTTTIDDKVIAALDGILEYLWYDEKTDYAIHRTMRWENKDISEFHHIFNDLMVVNHWLKSIEK